jgi:hypothetical protein
VKISPILVAVLALPSSLLAHPIKWTATGTVNFLNNTAAYPGVAVGDPVEVAFSYDSEAYIHGLSALQMAPGVSHFKAEFADAVDLKMAVKIGAQTWEAVLPFSPRGGDSAMHSLSWDGGGSPDTFTLTLSSSDSATFPAFPYAGVNTPRRMDVILNDTVAPCDLLDGQSLPRGTTDVSQISAATGSVSAGFDSIRFALNLASIKVVEEEPKIPITIQRTLTGLELKWYGEPGAVYQLLESGNLTDWEYVSDHEGLDEEISVTVEPFELHPDRRFYKVIEL